MRLTMFYFLWILPPINVFHLPAISQARNSPVLSLPQHSSTKYLSLLISCLFQPSLPPSTFPLLFKLHINCLCDRVPLVSCLFQSSSLHLTTPLVTPPLTFSLDYYFPSISILFMLLNVSHLLHKLSVF